MTSRNAWLARVSLAVALVLALIAAGYLASSGAHVGAPFVFAVLAALSLGTTMYLLARASLAVLVEPQADETRVATGRRRKELEREKQMLMKALKELAFDHEMRKISKVDFDDMSALYRARTVRVMRQLDEGALAYRREIDEELAARRDRAGQAEGHKAESAAPDHADHADRDDHVDLDDLHDKPAAAKETGT